MSKSVGSEGFLTFIALPKRFLLPPNTSSIKSSTTGWVS